MVVMQRLATSSNMTRSSTAGMSGKSYRQRSLRPLRPVNMGLRGQLAILFPAVPVMRTLVSACAGRRSSLPRPLQLAFKCSSLQHDTASQLLRFLFFLMEFSHAAFSTHLRSQLRQGCLVDSTSQNRQITALSHYPISVDTDHNQHSGADLTNRGQHNWIP
jgi:hypothetical protein